MNITNKPKYKVGDIVVYQLMGGDATSIFTIDGVEKNEDGDGYVYTHYYSPTCHGMIYEEDIIECLDKNSEKYKRYQMYLELKKEFGE